MAGRRIWVAGHNGIVSASVTRLLRDQGEEVPTVTSDLDLRDKCAVLGWLHRNNPHVIIFAAAKVGGIQDGIQLDLPMVSRERDDCTTGRLIEGSRGMTPPTRSVGLAVTLLRTRRQSAFNSHKHWTLALGHVYFRITSF